MGISREKLAPHPPLCPFFLRLRRFLRECVLTPQRHGNLQLQLHFLHFPPVRFLKDLLERRLRVKVIIL